MYQLRNLIHRTNIPTTPDKNMNAAEDFQLLMLHTHIVAAARTIQALNPVESVVDLAKLTIVNYTHFHQFTPDKLEPNIDGVHLYATKLASNTRNFFLCYSKAPIIATMQRKQLTCSFSITTLSLTGRRLNYCGVAASTLEVTLEPTFHVIFIWNTLTGISRQSSEEWVPV